MRIRFSLENLALLLFVLGGLGAIVFGELAMEGPKNISLGVVMLGIGVSGLDMIAKRKAEISMRYTNRLHPTFYVFHGIPAIGWGITIFLFVVLIVGYSVIDMTGWTSAKDYFGERPGIVITLVGVMITAWGVGNAGYATWRRGIQEGTVSRWQRLGDRITGVFVIPIGLCVTTMGVLYLVAPATALAVREAGRDWGISLFYLLKAYLESSRI